MTAARHPVITALTLALLGGCSGPGREVTHSPWPAQARGHAWCVAEGGPRHLSPGASCLAVVGADEWNHRTGLRTCAGQTFHVSVPGEQYWYDAGRRSHPLKGDEGSRFMNVFQGRKRVAGQNWFLLSAGTLPPGAVDDADPEHAAALPARVLSEPTVTYTARAAGELVFFANDARAFWPAPKLLYGNNRGHAWVVVRAEGPACGDAGGSLDSRGP